MTTAHSLSPPLVDQIRRSYVIEMVTLESNDFFGAGSGREPTGCYRLRARRKEVPLARQALQLVSPTIGEL